MSTLNAAEKMDPTAKSNNNKWIKCQSRTHGREYWFNKETGESQWCSKSSNPATASAEAKVTSSTSPAILPITKPLRTPAQDRLKRLQRNLLTSPTDMRKTRSKTSAQALGYIKSETAQTEELKNRIKDENEQSISNPYEKADNGEARVKTSSYSSASSSSLKQQSTVNPTKRTRKRGRPKLNCRRTPIKRSRSCSHSSDESTPKKQKPDPNDNQQSKESLSHDANLSAAFNLGNGLLNKIKEICKSTVSTYQKLKKNSKLRENNIQSQMGENSNNKQSKFDATDDEVTGKEAKNETDDLSVEIVPMDCDPIAVDTAGPSTSLIESVPNYIKSKFTRNSANARLELLRHSLSEQQKNSIEFDKLSTTGMLISKYSSTVTCCVVEKPVQADNDVEMTEDDKRRIVERSKSNFELSTSFDKIGDYYGTVNENLLRLAADQSKMANDSKKKWLEDYYYFIADTNVLLQHLTFIDDLSKMHLCDTEGTIIYIPYCVLQELDKLKISAASDGTKVLAVRAIKYLNSNFKVKNHHLKAQSASEEMDHLIEVISPDDGIINCCLQVKKQVPHVILLTEDINLRNKAICNNLLVSTKSDLTLKYSSST